MGNVIKLKPEKVAEYKRLHANVWPQVQQMIKECNIRNYSIYYKDGYLFSYYEYTGYDYDKDMAKMSNDQVTQEWWAITDPCQEPLDKESKGAWWSEMKEVFHLD